MSSLTKKLKERLKHTYLFKYMLERYLKSERYLQGYWRQISENSRKELLKYYNTDAPAINNRQKSVIVMFDGKLNHGGICDRLWGCVSAYNYCKANRIDFKIFFESPFRLTDYLVPNEYDWRINNESIYYNSDISTPVVIWSHININIHRGWTDTLQSLHSITHDQIHLYTNAHAYFATFKHCFDQLFRPSATLQKEIDKTRNEIGSDYVSLSFRFQNSLGDFDDIFSEPLRLEDRQILISKALGLVDKIKNKHKGLTVLITADSQVFLSAASGIDGTYIIPGQTSHPDFGADRDKQEVTIKMFLDLYMISMAKKAYLGINKYTYSSSFSKTAALIGGVKFRLIKF